MFAHSLLPLHAPHRPQPRRVESLAPTVPGHYVCTPAEPKEVSEGDYFSVWHSTPSSSSSAYPDTPGSVYSEPDAVEYAESEKLPAAPVRPLSFPPARGIPARKPKSRAVADVRRLEAAAEGWDGADDRHELLPVLGSAFSDGSSGSTTLASTPSMLSDISPVLVAWISPAPAAAVVVEETVERARSVPVVEERLSQARENPGDGVGNAVDAEGSGTRSQSQSHLKFASRAGWGFLPSLCSLKGMSLL